MERREAKAADAGAAKGGRATGGITVCLAGGPAAIDMWDLKAGAPEEVRGRCKPIDTRGGGAAGGSGYLGTAYNPFEVEGAPDKGQLRVRGVSLPQGFSLNELENRNKLLENLDSSFKALDQAGDVAAGLDKFHQQALD